MMATPFLFCIILCIFGSAATANATSAAIVLPDTEQPLIPDHPFVAVWNAPTDQCLQLHIPLDTTAFQAVTTPAKRPGQFLTIFYQHHLGLYPMADTTKHKIYRGGVPQNGNLTEHLSRAQSQIDQYISQDSSVGLAVIDWESWRPLWEQNFGSKHVYQKLSIAHAVWGNPFLSLNQIQRKAKSQFQLSSRRFMEMTIKLAVSLRPSRRWGFYLFPNCFNYGWKKANYTGKCSAKVKKQNNRLLWLWEQSTALFPSIYLHLALRNSPRAALYVRNRVQEALRVAALPRHPYTAPVYVYSRPLYRDQTNTFQSLTDLVSTVGESAALGASGVVMWGGSRDYNNKATCQSLSDYLTSTLSPYVANVTAAAMLCSEVLCQGRGRCLRKNYDSSHYLHLNPAHFHILQVDQKFVAVGQPSAADLNIWAKQFTCQCYSGSRCSPKLAPPTAIKTIWV
ncbi:hyaluronidase-1-like [Echeneis naucrates]|uniref:Hyaluronidase n=1 Tax=Echeneis naucrates TaxID=173247 RepID=A0A665U4N0_ECHNA|nr:hyaluronidase-1-like [Echeneis naucrates]